MRLRVLAFDARQEGKPVSLLSHWAIEGIRLLYAARETLTEARALRVVVVAERDQQFQTIRQGCGSQFEVIRSDLLSLPAIGQSGSAPDFDILIVSSPASSDQMLSALEAFALAMEIPILWFVDTDASQLAGNAIRRGVTSFVPGGLSPDRVSTLVTISIERHRMYQTLRRELKDASEELESRKIVERAKGLLMKGKSLSEEDAYKTMRSMAMNQGKTMKDIAKSVISLSDLMN